MRTVYLSRHYKIDPPLQEYSITAERDGDDKAMVHVSGVRDYVKLRLNRPELLQIWTLLREILQDWE